MVAAQIGGNMNKHIIICISGKQGSGKTTLAEELVKKYSGLHMKFAKVLYDIHDAAREVLGRYGYEMKKKDGKFLQVVGTEWGRNTLGQDIWRDLTRNAIMQAVVDITKWDKAFIVVDDARFDNELDMFHQLAKENPEWNVVTIRLEASEAVRKARCSEWRQDTNHPSEIGLDHRLDDFDIIVSTEIMSKEHVFGLICAEIEERG